MLRPAMHLPVGPFRLAALVGVALWGVACSSSGPTPPEADRPPPARTYAADEAPAPASTPVAPPVTTTATACDSAKLGLRADAVVAKVGDRQIKASELDPQAEEAEDSALRTYCSTVSRIRRAAVDSAIDDALLQQAAQAKGVDVESFVRGHLESSVPEPSEAEIEAYYAQFKKDGAPPLDQVRPQVVSAIRRDASEAAYGALLTSLRTETAVEVSLPDVRPAAQDVDVPPHSPSFGPDAAVVQVVEFSDFECPYCARAAEVVNEVKKRYGDRVKFAYRHFPLSFHPNAKPAAEYAQCAHEQGKFWEMHDAIFEHQRELGGEGLALHASSAGLDRGQLEACLSSGRPAQAIDDDMKKALAVGVEGTPTFFINGRQLEGGISTEALSAAIEAELALSGS